MRQTKHKWSKRGKTYQVKKYLLEEYTSFACDNCPCKYNPFKTRYVSFPIGEQPTLANGFFVDSVTRERGECNNMATSRVPRHAFIKRKENLEEENSIGFEFTFGDTQDFVVFEGWCDI